MKILRTDIFRFSIPMHPFTIATGTMHYAQNLFIRIHVDEGYYGVGECSAFPMIVGETQATCFEMARDFAALWKGKDAFAIEERMNELHDYTAFNATAKSAFDMALYDLSARAAGVPLYRRLGGNHRLLETDLTIGIDTPENMAAKAVRFRNDGVRIIKVKLGKDGKQDLERIRQIRLAIGEEPVLRIDANQGWDFETAAHALREMSPYRIQFCEQPMRRWQDHRLPELRKLSPIKIMADESVFDHHDAQRLIDAKACDYVNIKFAKSGGILEATRINALCERHGIPCMMGGMLESRIALTAFAHFALASDNIIFHDMDTCLLGHTADPVTGGVQYKGYFLDTPNVPGIGADAGDAWLEKCEKTTV
ncbi:MAG: dipeptide epimerase [Bacteroidota bacterium]|nr:dipeptide epimerase [Bacteroidota bacterium]MDP4218656.1 dipeptide epimerase [Bacteroidota bacterium]MDP4247328.1 dipeptide epimerase [Bacteroidota bacterium]MDP4256134.1 dipeptide epimerase [Bacteroidota bacterium]MDP4258142.1 dipeptide epimerase [Bacteroidota bacterium]